MHLAQEITGTDAFAGRCLTRRQAPQKRARIVLTSGPTTSPTPPTPPPAAPHTAPVTAPFVSRLQGPCATEKFLFSHLLGPAGAVDAQHAPVLALGRVGAVDTEPGWAGDHKVRRLVAAAAAATVRASGSRGGSAGRGWARGGPRAALDVDPHGGVGLQAEGLRGALPRGEGVRAGLGRSWRAQGERKAGPRSSS